MAILSGVHVMPAPRIIDRLCANGMDDVRAVAGGTIPAHDADELRTPRGRVFGPGAATLGRRATWEICSTGPQLGDQRRSAADVSAIRSGMVTPDDVR